MRRWALVILVLVIVKGQETLPPRLISANEIAGAMYKCGAIDGNIGMAKVLMQASDLTNKPLWTRAVKRLENDRAAAHCEQYLPLYNVARGEWRFKP